MFIKPDWPVPHTVKSIYTTRQGGISKAPFNSFNLATHVGDALEDVLANRQQLVDQACLPSEPIWLDQQHTDRAIQLHQSDLNTQVPPSLPQTTPIADASWTQCPGLVSVVMTADCLPILITNQAGTIVSAIHAGWKGLAKGIVSKTVQSFPAEIQQCPEQLIAWIGPAISAKHFEVGRDVYDTFVDQDAASASYFQAEPLVETLSDSVGQKYLADLPGLVKKELNDLGVSHVYGGELCTFALTEDFFSYRRSGKAGRMACLIWIEPNKKS
ncbi:MAG: peptidoglycan editing factor PgeF [Thiomicrorhabdus sp.]|jgi:YfiH family protein|nr:peptidoglycan editing factor PgeF [Thiomicrorhabdus sp.]